MRRRLRLSLLALFFLGGSFSFLNPIQAQLPSLSELQPLAYQQERESLRRLYREQIQAYQLAHRQYTLDLAQYQQLKTLAALELVVASTRIAMERRVEVLLTYLDLIHLELRYAPASNLADPSSKQALLRDLEDLRLSFQEHLQIVKTSQHRDAIGERASEFTPLFANLEILSYASRHELLLGKVRYAHVLGLTKLSLLRDEFARSAVGPLKEAERTRALREIERENASIDTLWQRYQKEVKTEVSVAKGMFPRAQTHLAEIQTMLIRFYTLLEEASQL